MTTKALRTHALRAQNESIMSRWVSITHEFFEHEKILPKDPPHILLMLCDKYDEPVYKRLTEY